MLWEGIDWRRPDWGAPPLAWAEYIGAKTLCFLLAQLSSFAFVVSPTMSHGAISLYHRQETCVSPMIDSALYRTANDCGMVAFARNYVPLFAAIRGPTTTLVHGASRRSPDRKVAEHWPYGKSSIKASSARSEQLGDLRPLEWTDMRTGRLRECQSGRAHRRRVQDEPAPDDPLRPALRRRPGVSLRHSREHLSWNFRVCTTRSLPLDVVG